MVKHRTLILAVVLGLIPSMNVFAASFVGSLQSLVSDVIGKIMPLCALPYVARNAYGYIRGDPQAVQQSPMVAGGVIALLGINSLWAFLQSHIR